MKRLFYLLAFVGVLFSSCEDNSVKLIIHSSAYEAVKDLKDANGNPYFTGKLENGINLRFSFLVVNEDSEEIVARDVRYVDDINSVASYTTDELEPGNYRIMVMNDFVKDGQEFNEVIVRTQYNGLYFVCEKNKGVYSAFGTAVVEHFAIDEKKEITLNTQRKGAMVTFLLKNTDKMIDNRYWISDVVFSYLASDDYNSGFYNVNNGGYATFGKEMTSIQYYCANTSYDSDFGMISWQGADFGYKLLTPGKDKVVILDFATNEATLQ